MRFAEILEEVLAAGHAASFRASGDSMHPTIRNGDRLQVFAPDDLRIGDVVLARAPRGLTAHRIVRFAGSSVVMRGDNALGNDEPVGLTDVLGRVISVERDGMTFLVPRQRYVPLLRLRAWSRRLLGPSISRKSYAGATNDFRLVR